MSANFSGVNTVQSGAHSNPSKPVPAYQYNTSATAAGTFTAVEIAGADSVVYDHTGASPGSKTLPTVAVLVAQDPAYALSRHYKLRIVNNQSTGSLTIVTAAGWTLSGSVVVAARSAHDYVISYDTAAAATLRFAGLVELNRSLATKFTANANTGAPATLTGAECAGADHVYLELTGAAPNTLTTPTAAQLQAADPGWYVGKSWILEILNPSGNTATIANGANVTITGDLTIVTVNTQVYVFTFATATTVTAVDGARHVMITP